MAKQTVNIGSTANDGTGDQLRTAFDKLNQNNDEIYGANFVTEDMLNDNIVGADELKVTGNGASGQILTSNADGTFSWATGVTGDITGVEAGAGLTGGGTGGDVILNVAAGTGITVTADEVALATTVQDEISLNTLKTGITDAQAAEIEVNNDKLSYNSTASTKLATIETNADVTDTANVTTAGALMDSEVTNLAQVKSFSSSDYLASSVTTISAGQASAITANTAKVVITSAQASEIAANTLKEGITTAQAGEIVVNNGKFTNANHTGDVTGDGQLTIQDAVVTAAKLDVSNTGANGQILQYNTDGTMTWVTGVTGDITRIIATDGLTTPDGTGGDVTIGLAAGVAGDGLTLTTGVLSVDTIQTGDIADDAITSAKLALFVDDLAATDTHILIANGTDFDNKPMSGDATMANTGAITISNNAITTDKILNDAVDADKLAPAINTLISDNTDKTGITSQQITDIGINNGKFTNATHTGDVEGSGVLTLVDNKVITSKILNSNVTYAKIQDVSATNRILGRDSAGAGIVEEITPTSLRAMISVADGANNYVHPDHSGDVTSSADGATVIATDAVTTAKILNDNVTHDKLENRYTAINPIGTTTGAFDIDFSLGAIHTVALNGAHTGTFTNFKIGQVIDIIIIGNHALTFSATATGTPAINKVGTTAYDGTATQIIQVQCASDDSTTPIFYYVCNTYAGDPTP